LTPADAPDDVAISVYVPGTLTLRSPNVTVPVLFSDSFSVPVRTAPVGPLEMAIDTWPLLTGAPLAVASFTVIASRTTPTCALVGCRTKETVSEAGFPAITTG